MVRHIHPQKQCGFYEFRSETISFNHPTYLVCLPVRSSSPSVHTILEEAQQSGIPFLPIGPIPQKVLSIFAPFDSIWAQQKAAFDALALEETLTVSPPAAHKAPL